MVGIFSVGFVSVFGSLSLSILAALSRFVLPLGPRRVSLWLPLLVCSLILAVWFNYLSGYALLAIVGYILLAQASTKLVTRKVYWLYGCAIVGLLVMSLALALHIVPGFNNPLLLDNVFLGQHSTIPFSLHANYDKGIVGIALLSLLMTARNAHEGGHFVSSVWLNDVRDYPKRPRYLLLALPLICLSINTLAFAFGLPLDIKFDASILLFFWCNFLFSCVAEEAFFRLLIQDNIAMVCRQLFRARVASALAVGVSAMLFLLAHAGGITQVEQGILIGLAGVFYAWTYGRTGSLGCAIGVHFGVNAIHIAFLRYPMVF